MRVSAVIVDCEGGGRYLEKGSSKNSLQSVERDREKCSRDDKRTGGVGKSESIKPS